MELQIIELDFGDGRAFRFPQEEKVIANLDLKGSHLIQAGDPRTSALVSELLFRIYGNERYGVIVVGKIV